MAKGGAKGAAKGAGKGAGKGAAKSGQGTPATVALARAGVPFTLHPYDHDPAVASYGLEAAEALGVPPERVFKTLLAEVDGALTVAVVPVAGQLDLKALAGAAGGKRAAMADPAAAERVTGYVRGGISPLGQRRQLPTVVDTTALDHPTVFVSAGRRGLDVELAPADLVRLTRARSAPIGRGGPAPTG
jgi:Cys-tRNA(Pro)/Cys-tRNA(Cys) deacylase